MSITTSMEVMIQNHFNKFFEELKFQGIELSRDLIKDIEDLEYNCIEVTKSQNSTEHEEWYENGYESGFENGRENGYDDGHDDGCNYGLEKGYDDGFEEGQDEGYKDGYKTASEECECTQ